MLWAIYERDGDTEHERLALGSLPKDLRQESEERAAVLQFDANMSRRAATRAALVTTHSVTRTLKDEPR